MFWRWVSVRLSSGLAVVFFGLLLVLSVYGVGATPRTELVFREFDFSVMAFAYHSQFGKFSNLSYPILIGSYRFGDASVFPVFHGEKSVFMVPGAYGGHLNLGLVSTGPVNVSVYGVYDFVASFFFDVSPAFSAGNVTRLQASVQYPSVVYSLVLRIFLDSQLFPAPQISVSTIPPLVVSVESGGSDAFVAVTPIISGVLVTQNPQYLFSWALLIFSGVFLLLTLLGEVIPRVTEKDIFERNILWSGVRIALREPLRVVLPFTLCLIPIFYLLHYNFWAAAISLSKFQTIVCPFSGGFAGPPLPFHLAVSVLASLFIFIIPLLPTINIAVYYSVGKVYFETVGEEGKPQSETGVNIYLLVGILLAGILVYLDYTFFSRVAGIHSYGELYDVGIVALFSVVLASLLFLALFFGYTLRMVSVSADRDERSPGEIISKMWRPGVSLLKTGALGFLILLPGIVLSLIGLYFLNPFTYLPNVNYSSLVWSSLNITMVSGALIVSALLAPFLALAPILSTVLYFRLKAESSQEPKWKTLERNRPSWFEE